ncbi:MAG: VTT domain-containing protein [Deltaproteobacteria bacterium]|nr:VTT domain-containing protein [Deltaproteobacteria bacterium]
MHHGAGSNLAALTSDVAAKCTRCAACRQDCAFLRKYGTPGEVAASYDPADKLFQLLPFECSLCQLCAAVCPVKLKPSDLFLEMRREKIRRDPLDYPEHAGLLAYEKRGASQRFTYYAIPENCDTVFFPGCTLTGTRSETTFNIYDHLKQFIPSLGIVLDCCLKISHDLGRKEYFQAMFREMKDFLVQSGVKKVIVACPNCHRIFDAYGEELKVSTIYEIMDEHSLPFDEKIGGTVTVHDPCPLRFSPAVHASVRSLVAKQGLTIEEMPHHGEDTLCCGEGGFVTALSPDLAAKWKELRKDEAAGRRMVTYCAGCTNHLNGITPTSHIVDLLWAPEATIAGKVRITKGPFTYLNRLKLKKKLKQRISAPVTRERTFTGDGLDGREGKKKDMAKRILLLGAIAAVILAVRLTGATRYLEQETLRQWVEGYGGLAPFVYMLVYALAPSLLLPGLPLTIAGGILFGPFWGVVYAITGATTGACIAFLVARYVARDWVERKLRGPQWRRLDEGVERHGWKVVAFTRLIPLFPFNLLNYAFGLTRVKFLHYAVATFFCMLPACIAFIVFSSSLLDVLKGRISPTFVAGLGLVILVSLIPLLYGRYKKKKGIHDPL